MGDSRAERGGRPRRMNGIDVSKGNDAARFDSVLMRTFVGEWGGWIEGGLGGFVRCASLFGLRCALVGGGRLDVGMGVEVEVGDGWRVRN